MEGQTSDVIHMRFPISTKEIVFISYFWTTVPYVPKQDKRICIRVLCPTSYKPFVAADVKASQRLYFAIFRVVYKCWDMIKIFYRWKIMFTVVRADSYL